MELRRRDVALAQGIYYGATGIWPLVNRRSFELVTGRKTDWWLVQSLSLVLLPVGLALGLAGASGRVPVEIQVLGAGAAGVLGGADVAIAARRLGRPTYLIDALASGAIVVGWALARRP